jgi:hypothetical protein
MAKAERQAKITELEKALKAKVICFLTSDRPNVEAPANWISKDCVKVFEQHLAINDKCETLALFLVSHGGDMDVPWPLVNLLRGHCKKLQAVIPYVCHSAATQIVLGCDELVAGRRAQLSPTDPMLQIRTGTDENSPIMNVGVEDINAFVKFVRNSLGREFSRYGHEALTKLMDTLKPPILGSVNRTYLRSRLLIEKMRGLTSRKVSKKEMDRLVDYLTVAYFAHSHFISREEMIHELKLKVVPAENLKIDALIWELYEEYANEFQSRKPYDMQGELQGATTNPVTVQIKGKYVESTPRTDVYIQTTTLQGTGIPNINFTLPQNVQVSQQDLQTIINHLSQQLSNQLKPFQVAKKLSSYGEWKTE